MTNSGERLLLAFHQRGVLSDPLREPAVRARLAAFDENGEVSALGEPLGVFADIVELRAQRLHPVVAALGNKLLRRGREGTRLLGVGPPFLPDDFRRLEESLLEIVHRLDDGLVPLGAIAQDFLGLRRVEREDGRECLLIAMLVGHL